MIFILTVLLAAAVEDSYAVQAHKMITKHSVAMVSTITTEKGIPKPYGSVMPFALTKGLPYVFISDLAVHTDNIKKNPNVSFVVFQPDKNGNVFNGARVTFSGKLVMAKDKKVIAKLRKAYLAKHPVSKIFINFGDFNFYVLEIEEIYFIGGFGEIGVVDLKDYKKATK